MTARSARVAWHGVHVLGTFAITLGGMLWAKHQPVTLDLVLSLLPAAAVATLRALEARGKTSPSNDARQQANDPARPG